MIELFCYDLPMLESRLALVSKAQQSTGFPCPETTSSARCPWAGFLLERNVVPPTELPALIFPFPSVGLVVNDKPIQWHWRENSRDHQTNFSKGTILVAPASEMPPMWSYEPHTALTVSFEPSFLDNAIRESTPSSGAELQRETSGRDNTVANLILALESEMENGCGASRLLGESIGIALAAALLQKFSTRDIVIRDFTHGLSKRALRLALEYVEAHLHEELTLQQLARMVSISPYYFNRLFKQSMGLSFHQYVLQQRLQRARSLLTFTGTSLTEVALQCGFAHQSHFTTCFKRAIGATPKTFRIQTQP